MFAASLALQGLAARTGAPDVSTGIEAVIGEFDDAIAEIRGAIFTLHRPALDRNMPGVRVRILKVAARLADVLAFTPSLTFSGPVEEVASEEITEHLLAVVGEALSNIARHAHASAAVLSLSAGGIAARMRAEGLSPHGWGNGAGLLKLKHTTVGAWVRPARRLKSGGC